LAAVTDTAAAPTVRDVVDALDRRYPRDWAESWDRVGLVLGAFDHRVTRILCVVDCVPETVEQALDGQADLIVAHHPLIFVNKKVKLINNIETSFNILKKKNIEKSISRHKKN